MKRIIVLFVVIFISSSIGYIIGKNGQNISIKPSTFSPVLDDIKEKCKTADIKGDIYFKKYDINKNEQESMKSKEWFDAQSWEQACTESLNELRSQLTDH
jgi:hypothetical protein